MIEQCERADLEDWHYSMVGSIPHDVVSDLHVNIWKYTLTFPPLFQYYLNIIINTLHLEYTLEKGEV